MTAPVRTDHKNFEFSSKIDKTNLEDNSKVQLAGKSWRRTGGALLATGVVVGLVSVLAICILTTNLGQHVSKWGEGGARMVNWMGANANAVMIGGFSAAGLSFLVLIPTSIVCLSRANAQREKAKQEELDRLRHVVV